MSKFLKSLSRTLRQPFNSLYAQRRLKQYHSKQRSLEEVIDWAMKFRGGGYMTVNTLQIPAEITQLAQAVAGDQIQKPSSRSAPREAAHC